LRVIAVVGHVLTALITTNIFDNELSHVLHASTPREVLHRGYALTAIIAFVLGYFVYYKWHSAPGKWIWIVASCGSWSERFQPGTNLIQF
jgi:hypothetical protein